MVNRAGKQWLLCSMLITSCVAYSAITLRVRDMRGIPLKEVAAGHPCKIELVIDGANRRMENPEIKGLEHFQVEGRETSMQMINGETTVTYGFRARCSKPGSYTIGPAQLSIEGTVHTSNVVQVNVVAAPDKASQKTASCKVFARLNCSKKHAVVGEKVGMSMRFYYDGHDSVLRDVGNPPEQGYTRKGQQGPFSGSEVVNGNLCHYVEWTWDMYPTHAGTLAIPAYSFDYDTPKEDGQDHAFSAFSVFFNRQRYDRHRIYSNACQLEVESIPGAAHNATQHVGQFTTFTARVAPAQVHEGDGMVLTLELAGDADLDTITLAPLTMPNAFKWYDSQASAAQQVSATHAKKSWEYIVQGLQAGTWEIPAQHFTYFDTRKRATLTLSTTPITVTVMPRAAAAAQEPSTKPTEDNEPDDTPGVAHAIDIVDPSGIRPIHESGQWYAHQERSVPLWLYVLLMIIPIGFVMIRWFFNHYAQNLHHAARKRYLFKQGRTQLLLAERVGKAESLYQLFVSIISCCTHIPESMVTDESIDIAWRKAGLTDAQRAQWHQFFTQAAAYAYASNKQRIPDDFFKQASQWLDVCEKQL